MVNIHCFRSLLVHGHIGYNTIRQSALEVASNVGKFPPVFCSIISEYSKNSLSRPIVSWDIEFYKLKAKEMKSPFDTHNDTVWTYCNRTIVWQGRTYRLRRVPLPVIWSWRRKSASQLKVSVSIQQTLVSCERQREGLDKSYKRVQHQVKLSGMYLFLDLLHAWLFHLWSVLSVLMNCVFG